MDAPKRPRWKNLLLEIALFAAVFAGIQWWQTRGLPRGPLPALAAPGLDGEPLSIEALRGKPALVHFWATWCGVCKAEEGNIVALARDRPMVTVASSSGEAEDVKRYLAGRGVRLPVIVDPEGEIARRFGVHAFPTTFVLGSDGEVRSALVGYTTKLGLLARLWLAD